MPEIIVHIKDTEITNRRTVKEAFTGLSNGKYLVKIDSIKKRSLPQNAYYWSVVVPMVKQGLRDAGYNEVKTNNDAHEVMKQLFLKKRYRSEKTDDEIVIAGSTAELKTVAFNEYLEEIWQWAASYLGITIPAPNEQLTMLATHDQSFNATIIERI